MLLWLLFIFAAVSVLIILAVIAAYIKKSNYHATSALISYLFYAFIFTIIWVFNLEIPPYIIILPLSAVFISCFFGHYMDWYSRFRAFDCCVHLYGAFSFALLTYYIIENFIKTGGSKLFLSIFVFTAGVTLGALYELIEAAHDAKSNAKSQPNLNDTNMDILFDFLGSAAAGVFAYYLIF